MDRTRTDARAQKPSRAATWKLKQLCWAYGCTDPGSGDEKILRAELLRRFQASASEANARDAAASAQRRVEYWLAEYQAEADENYQIRAALGVSTEDPDERITARAVTAAIDEAREARDGAIQLLRILFPQVELPEEWDTEAFFEALETYLPADLEPKATSQPTPST